VQDSPAKFYEDTVKGARELARPELIKVLANESADSVHWLEDSFALDMGVLGRLGGHSFPRTHRGKEQFPGMTITYALMERMEEICKKEPHRARVVNRAVVKRVITDGNGVATGVEYEHKGSLHTAEGPVVIATGGYGADFSANGLLAKYRPELANSNIATTNGEHCTGDGIRMAEQIGANTVDMKQVQVHPTGLVDPRDPNSKVKVRQLICFLSSLLILLVAGGRGAARDGGDSVEWSGTAILQRAGPPRLRDGRDEQGQGPLSPAAQLGLRQGD
jgi:succinate dehydrogenase/fumarate reductase flavoprotein subunit